jgi:hypothetical protein
MTDKDITRLAELEALVSELTRENFDLRAELHRQQMCLSAVRGALVQAPDVDYSDLCPRVSL